MTIMHITPAYITVHSHADLPRAWERYGHRADFVPGVPGLIRFRCTEPLTKAQLRSLHPTLRKLLTIGPKEVSRGKAATNR
jgi:hypothetical protein